MKANWENRLGQNFSVSIKTQTGAPARSAS